MFTCIYMNIYIYVYTHKERERDKIKGFCYRGATISWLYTQTRILFVDAYICPH